MRYTELVKFYKSSPTKYNPDTGRRETTTRVLSELMCNITSVGLKRQIELFGELTRGHKSIRPLGKPPQEWSFLLINNKKYTLDTELETLKGIALVVSESG